MGQARNPVEHPTVGEIKRALHELSSATCGSAQHDGGESLREAHDLLRQLALRNGIDPDDALRRSLAAVASLRERLALATATASDQISI
jgi:hypothetical protein